MPNTPANGGPAVGTPSRPRGQTDRSPQTQSSTLHWQQKVKASIDRDIKLGASRTVTAQKVNAERRRIVDMQVINKHAVRETQHTQSPFNLATLVPSWTKKTITDAWNRYHSVPIREEYRHLITFITPWGRYRYRTCPQGYAASQEGFTRRFDEIVNDFSNRTNCIDDMLMGRHCRKKPFSNILLARHLRSTRSCADSQKIAFGSDTVEFAGFVITPTDNHPSDKHICAIHDFPTPQNRHPILVQPHQPSVVMRFPLNDMTPLRERLKPWSTFYRDDQLQQVFRQSKAAILEKITEGVRIFDSKRVTGLATDWSKKIQKYTSSNSSPSRRSR